MYKDMIKPHSIILLDFVSAQHMKELKDGLKRFFQHVVKLLGVKAGILISSYWKDIKEIEEAHP